MPRKPNTGSFCRPRGHSLVEILVVVAIIAIVVALICGIFAQVYRVIDSWR